MAQRAQAPVWINLEYLSAEAYPARNHGLPSPQLAGPAAGMTKWFFFPGFDDATGGLIREPGLLKARDRFDRASWLASRAIDVAPYERLVSLFCYANAAVPALLQRLADQPTLVLCTPEHAIRQASAAAGTEGRLGELRVRALPWVSQHDYDRLLWSCDLNCVRGEDSWVRGIWAGAPMLWQPYPQADDLHIRKVDAYLERTLDGAPEALSGPLRRLARAWAGAGVMPEALPDLDLWRNQARDWCDALACRRDLTTALVTFVAERS
jgi:uncharacterized repeat protein (TIGR03837 family)